MDKTTAAWKAAGERGDAAAAAECLAEGAELVSPLTAQFRFRGRERVGEVLTVAFQVVDGIRYHTEVGDGGRARCSSPRAAADAGSRRRSCCASTPTG
ncbi:hypothetical protein ACFQXA_07895 [Nocardiopsis composta]